MASVTLLDDVSLAAQIQLQRKHAWDLERDIDWKKGVDPRRYLLPLDNDAIAFPGATDRQRLALSQLMGLVINSTISEMENVIHKLKDSAWDALLRHYPVNPEIRELGELFFAEEHKHSLAFDRYIQLFCETMDLRRTDLDRLLPKAFGSLFLRAIIANARMGGCAFWWVVASVEEVSIEIYRQIHPHRAAIDPLFYAVHRKHLEDEARHRSYAFLMLELIEKTETSLLQKVYRKGDLLWAQVFSSGWVIAELHKIFEAEDLRKRHPFFETIAECLPLLRKISPASLLRRFFVSAPYISLVLNAKNHRLTLRAAQQQKMPRFPLPEPKVPPIFTANPGRAT
jgi:hypothetical protein